MVVIGIVGGGISGLATHHYCQQAGGSSVLWEADSEPGGAMRSRTFDGRVLDCGPQRMRLTPPLRTLIEDAGIADAVIEAADVPIYMHHAGSLREVPRSLRSAIATDLLSWRGKARLLAEPLIGAQPSPGESVLAYFRRTCGDEFATRIAGPLYAGLYASDPTAMPVEHSLARALERFGVHRSILLRMLRAGVRGAEPPPVVSFTEGMAALPVALAEQYPASTRLETPVRSITRETDGFAIETDRETTVVEQVVLTTPADVTAELIREIDRPSAEALAGLTYNPLVIVHILADTDLVGSGHHVTYPPETVTQGVTWNDSLFGDHPGRNGVYTCFLGGAARPDVTDWDDDELGKRAATEFELMTGHAAEPISVCTLSRAMPAYDHTWDAFDRVSLPDGIHLCGNFVDRAGIPGRVMHAQRVASHITSATGMPTDGQQPPA